ncbi:3',5'-cyclic nucleotide phosphodiesterase [Verrucomicrobia bacterium]|nr:3',5'-cyclic nucleotide phosphodiesterase [Verrucomicrobiota bacterium]
MVTRTNRIHGLSKGALVPIMAFLASCQPLPDDPSSPDSADSITFESLGFDSDSFDLASTKERQLKVFEALFMGKDGYRIPGDPDPARLRAFFSDLRESYFLKAEGIDYALIKRQYHTFTHAMDVMITTHALLRSGGGVYLSPGEQAVLVLAALGHDAVHTGVNNTFLINSKHPYFIETGADSLQEKRSIRQVMALLEKHEILVVSEGMKKALQDEIIGARNLIEQSILWTDISRHKEQMNLVTALVPQLNDSLAKARGSDGEGATKGANAADLDLAMQIHSSLPEEARVLLASFFLHVADISNPGRDWDTCERWAGLVMNEFFSQGDLEKKLGLPVSMNCDREKVLVPFAQIGFGKFVIRDLYALLSQTLHFGGNYLLNNFEINQRKWQEIEEEVKASGKPYSIRFEPPSKDGGWLGR